MVSSVLERAVRLGTMIVDRVNDELLRKNLTHSDLASQMGCTKVTLSRIMAKARAGTIGMSQLLWIADTLQLPVSYLIPDKLEEVECMDSIIRRSLRRFAIGEVVELPDILGDTWRGMEVGPRLSLGKRFNRDVIDGLYPGVRFIGKGTNNHAKYQITRAWDNNDGQEQQ